jgi:hypothetical protein
MMDYNSWNLRLGVNSQAKDQLLRKLRIASATINGAPPISESSGHGFMAGGLEFFMLDCLPTLLYN